MRREYMLPPHACISARSRGFPRRQRGFPRRSAGCRAAAQPAGGPRAHAVQGRSERRMRAERGFIDPSEKKVKE